MYNLQLKLTKIITKIDWVLIFLILISILPLTPLLHSGMFQAHDSESHVARLVSFYQSLSEGIIIPRWAENLNMGYGHPVLMFLYPLSNYIGSVWHLLGFSFIDSVKTTFGVYYVFSGIFMYMFGKSLFGKMGGFLISVLYLFSPYRFVDLYTRAALGEHLAFTFMPLVMWSFTRLFTIKSQIYLTLAALSLALLILSHNAISLMFIPFLFLYLAVFYYKNVNKPNNPNPVIIAIVLGFMLSAFFWIPAFLEGKYTLRDVLTKGDYASRFPDFLSFFYSPKAFGGIDELPMEIGMVNWIVLFTSVIYLLKIKKMEFHSLLILLSTGYFFITFILMNKISLGIWNSISILQKFQFPWRLLSMSVFTSAIACISLILITKSRLKRLTLILATCFFSIIYTINYWHPVGYLNKNDKYYINDYKGTTDTGESSPLWSLRGMEQRSLKKVELIGGKGIITAVERKSTLHSYKIDAQTDIQILDNTVYFPGWKVLVDQKEIPIEYQDLNHRGLMTFYVPKGQHDVSVVFVDTRIRMAANMISLVGFIVIFGILISGIRNLKFEKIQKI